jgi:hypothetical protein
MVVVAPIEAGFGNSLNPWRHVKGLAGFYSGRLGDGEILSYKVRAISPPEDWHGYMIIVGEQSSGTWRN